MCNEYVSCHRTMFGGTTDLEYIKVPGENGEVPGMPFFDLRPLTEAGDLPRPTAVQKIIDHYFEILTYALGKNTVEQAFVANEILTSLIKAMFDEEYGYDHFSISDLMSVVKRYQEFGVKVIDADEPSDAAEAQMDAIPTVSDSELRETLESHFNKDRRQFINTTDAVLNRIRKLKERDFIWNMLAQDIPDDQWDDENDWYAVESEPMFDYREVLNCDKTFLIDTGDIQGESSEMFTVLFLSHLWTAGRSIWTPNNDEHIVNLIIEESANIVRSKIVYEDLLPQGRKFNLSMGLIMQYPEQVLGENPDANQRAYGEMLNNVKTKLIGNIKSDDDLSESLFHEDLDAEKIKTRIAGLRQGEWVCELPPTGFQEDKAEILTVDALPLPPGHSESPFDVPANSEQVRKKSREKYCIQDGYTSQTDRTNSSSENESSHDNEDTDDSNDTDPDDLGFAEKSFIDTVADALSDGIDDYTLAESMTNLRYSEHADDLDDKGYLEEKGQGNNKVYYMPTEKALEIQGIDVQPENGGELGSESFTHRFGTRLAATWLEQRGYRKVMMYYTPPEETNDNGDGPKFDIFALPGKESDSDRRKIVEVEMSTDVGPHVTDDYETIADAYGDGVWIVDDFESAQELVSKLIDGGCIPDDVDQRVRSFDDLNDQLNFDGISRVLSITDLMSKVE